ncbi:hypothetical protein [Aeromonas phage PVN05]|nr:hypothetical protein [Aeromonas phage PVN05]
MKKFVVAALAAAFITGCAVPQEMRDSQFNELDALHQYHKAEKKAYRAGETLKAAQAATAVATVNKVAADIELKKAEKNLEESLSK